MFAGPNFELKYFEQTTWHAHFQKLFPSKKMPYNYTILSCSNHLSFRSRIESTFCPIRPRFSGVAHLRAFCKTAATGSVCAVCATLKIPEIAGRRPRPGGWQSAATEIMAPWLTICAQLRNKANSEKSKVFIPRHAKCSRVQQASVIKCDFVLGKKAAWDVRATKAEYLETLVKSDPIMDH